MKIAFFVDSFPNVSETFVLNQVTGLIDRGHDVHIYARKVESNPIVHSDVVKYDLGTRTYAHGDRPEIMRKNPAIRLLKVPGMVIGNFRQNLPILIKSLNVHQFGRRALTLRLFYRAQPFLGNGGAYDVVHCHFGPNGNLAAGLKRLGVLRGHLITTFHGYDLSKYVKKRGANVYQDLFEHGDLFLPVSNHWKNVLIRMGCHPNKIRLHRMGIETKDFKFVPRRPKYGQDVIVLTVARLVEKKGVAYAIRALAKAREEFHNLRYIIVGDGLLRQDLESLIVRLDLADCVEMVGWKPQHEVRELMKTADLLLAPSVTDSDGNQEGIPVVLMEALAHGLPVISTYHSGIPELVKDGVFGFLVSERHVTALADRLIYLASHQELWAEMARAGREYVESYYDVEKLNNRLIALYEGLRPNL